MLAKRATEIEESLTLAITAKAKKMKASGADIISFGAGEPDFDTPDYIKEAAVEALKNGMTRYTPSAGTLTLRQAICDKLLKDNNLSYSPDQIVVSNGAKQSLYNACLALIDKGDEVIVPAPYWLTYPELVRLSGGVVRTVKTSAENSFKLTPEALRGAINNKTKLLILNSPSNPCGTVYTREELSALAQVIEETGIYVLSDEIYEKLVYNGNTHHSIASISKTLKERTIVVNGVSKSYAMTGWRIGYASAERPLAKAMDNIQSHTTSNPNSIAQYATQIALSAPKSDAFLKEMNQTFEKRLNLAEKELTARNIKFVRPSGAFYIMIDIRPYLNKALCGTLIRSAQDFAEGLLEAKAVAVIPCLSFGAPDYIRISYTLKDEDIVRGIKRILEFVQS